MDKEYPEEGENHGSVMPWKPKQNNISKTHYFFNTMDEHQVKQEKTNKQKTEKMSSKNLST